jgi:hypothetical protein
MFAHGFNPDLKRHAGFAPACSRTVEATASPIASQLFAPGTG